jgi:hypothetical protein
MESFPLEENPIIGQKFRCAPSILCELDDICPELVAFYEEGNHAPKHSQSGCKKISRNWFRELHSGFILGTDGWLIPKEHDVTTHHVKVDYWAQSSLDQSSFA